MRLIDEAEAARLYEAMAPARELSGGSAGNTVAGLASFGLKAGFIGQLADDQLGQIFTHDIRSLGVEFDTPPRGDVGATARCLILVTPDAQRTMNTFLGAAQMLEPHTVDPMHVAQAQDRLSRRLFVGPGGAARGDVCGDGRGPRSRDQGRLHSCPTASSSTATATTSTGCSTSGGSTSCSPMRPRSCSSPAPTISTPRSTASPPRCRPWSSPAAKRARSPVAAASSAEVAAEPIERLVDTTGAGDLFAAGFLAGEARGLGLEKSLKLGAIAAAEVIQHYGARPEADLKALAGDLLA